MQTTRSVKVVASTYAGNPAGRKTKKGKNKSPKSRLFTRHTIHSQNPPELLEVLCPANHFR